MSNVTHVHKRALNHCDSDQNDLKRRKLNKSDDFKVMSNLFTHRADIKQFEAIFNSVDQSSLVVELNTPKLIIKQIAEYATGGWVYCDVIKCKESISILYQDSLSSEYKLCPTTEAFFCHQCINDIVWCGDLQSYCNCNGQFYCVEDCYHCYVCNRLLPPCAVNECCNCNNFGCYQDYTTKECYMKECKDCGHNVCNECCKINPLWEDKYCICETCYVDTTIKCPNCNIKCKLWYKNNCSLDDGISDSMMIKCVDTCCQTFICQNCGSAYECKQCSVKKLHGTVHVID